LSPISAAAAAGLSPSAAAPTAAAGMALKEAEGDRDAPLLPLRLPPERGGELPRLGVAPRLVDADLACLASASCCAMRAFTPVGGWGARGEQHEGSRVSPPGEAQAHIQPGKVHTKVEAYMWAMQAKANP
jgi:hypothetical protein